MHTGKKRGARARYRDRVRLDLYMEREQAERARELARGSGMDVSAWITGILLAAFARADRERFPK